MRVALDTNGLYTTQAGVARHIRGLVKGLERLRSNDFNFFELAWKVENFEYRQPRRAIKTFYRELVWPRFTALGLLQKERSDLLHSTVDVLVRPREGLPHVATLHDLAVLRHPERFRHWHRFATTQRLQRLREVDRVICISQATADEAISLLGLPARKMEVVYNGCDFHDLQVEDQEPLIDPALPAEFFLFVGSLEPGKNLSLLNEVYRLAKEQGHALPDLLIVGARWAGVEKESAPPANWHYLGRQPDQILISLYRRAIALLFPSRYEGFGLPVAEAMTLGCPVICSPVSSLPEVGGDAVLFSELAPKAYLESMRRLVSDSGLRSELVRRGKSQAKKFTWEKCAEQTFGVYRQVLGV